MTRYIVEVKNAKIAEFKSQDKAQQFITTMQNIDTQYKHSPVKYSLLVL